MALVMAMPAARLRVVGPLAAAGALALTLTTLRMRPQRCQDELAEADGGVKLQVEVGVEQGAVHLQERAARRGPGVVDENINALGAFGDGRKNALDRCWIGNVACVTGYAARDSRLQFGERLFDNVSAACDNDHVGARPAEPLGNGAPDASAPPGHKRCPAGQIDVHRPLLV
jgi:hypothetical protein